MVIMVTDVPHSHGWAQEAGIQVICMLVSLISYSLKNTQPTFVTLS